MTTATAPFRGGFFCLYTLSATLNNAQLHWVYV